MAVTVKTKTTDVTATDRFVSHLASIAAAVIFVCILNLTYGVDLSPGLF